MHSALFVLLKLRRKEMFSFYSLCNLFVRLSEASQVTQVRIHLYSSFLTLFLVFSTHSKSKSITFKKLLNYYAKCVAVMWCRLYTVVSCFWWIGWMDGNLNVRKIYMHIFFWEMRCWWRQRLFGYIYKTCT